MDNTLIVIIDPQHDFINQTGEYAKKHSGIKQILHAREKINGLLKDLHRKEKIVIVYSDYEKNQFENGLSICIPGTIGNKVDLEMEMDDRFTLIPKNNHSCFSSELFTTYLQTHFVDRIILCGFLAEYCVKQTAIDGLKNGYHVSLLKEYIGTGDDVLYRKEQMLLELADAGAEILNGNL
jgi:nicotinamidase/pyrazinamidase